MNFYVDSIKCYNYAFHKIFSSYIHYRTWGFIYDCELYNIKSFLKLTHINSFD